MNQDFFLSGLDPREYLESEEQGLKDFGKLLVNSSQSRDAARTSWDSVRRGAWQGGVNLGEWGNLSGEKGENHLSHFITNFRSLDSVEDLEVGLQKWLLIAGNLGLVLCTSQKTHLLYLGGRHFWSEVALPFEAWPEGDVTETLGEISSINVCVAATETDFLEDLVHRFNFESIVQDDDFEVEVAEDEELGDRVFDLTWYAWETKFGYPVFCHFGSVSLYFGGPISPNPGSTFRRLWAWMLYAKNFVRISGSVGEVDVEFSESDSKLEVFLKEDVWDALGETPSGKVGLYTSSQEARKTLSDSLIDFKLDDSIVWLPITRP